MKKLLFLLLFLPFLGNSQGIVKTTGLVYTSGVPVHVPSRMGSAIALDTVSWRYYTWNGTTWLSDGFRVQTISGCSAPAYTPTKFQSYLVINTCTAGQGGPELYSWTGAAWVAVSSIVSLPNQELGFGTGSNLASSSNLLYNGSTLRVLNSNFNLNNSFNTIQITTGLQSSTSSVNSIKIGESAGETSTTNNAIFMGQFSGQNATGSNIIGFGRSSFKSSSATNSYGIGDNTGEFSSGAGSFWGGSGAGRWSSGTNAIGLGESAADSIGILATDIIAIGRGSLRKCLAPEVIGIGFGAGAENTTGQYNMWGGVGSGSRNKLGSRNSTWGWRTLFTNEGNGNSVFGESGSDQSFTMDGGTLMGQEAGHDFRGGDYNTGTGFYVFHSAEALPVDSMKIGVGYEIFVPLSVNFVPLGAANSLRYTKFTYNGATLPLNTGARVRMFSDSSNYNVAYGYRAGQFVRGDSSIYLGSFCGYAPEYGPMSNRFYVSNSSTLTPLLNGRMEGLNRLGINKPYNHVLDATLHVGGDIVIDSRTGGTATKMATFTAAGKLIETDLPAAFPTGTINQTLRHDGTTFVATSFITNNGSGVGIGTSSPATPLDVVGQVKVSDGTVGEMRLRANNTDARVQSFGSVPLLINPLGNAVKFPGIANGNVFFPKILADGEITSSLNFVDGASYFNIQSFAGKPLYLNELGNNIVTGNLNFGINTITPSEKLDVVGNVKFSGALMPNNTAGTSGQVLTSAGAGVAPIWANGPFNGNYTAIGTATTVFTVTLPTTQPDATYSVSIMPKNALSATGWYISARTTTTFEVTYLTGLTGAVDFDYIIVN